MNELLKLVQNFNEVRGWRKYHDPRSLVLALCGEVGELAQLVRWRQFSVKKLSLVKRQSINSEVADIFIFLLAFCLELGIDPEQVVKEKLSENEIRFPTKGKE